MKAFVGEGGLEGASLRKLLTPLKTTYAHKPHWEGDQSLPFFGRLFAELIKSTPGQRAIAAFRAVYPSAEITDTKIIYLILWQTR